MKFGADGILVSSVAYRKMEHRHQEEEIYTSSKQSYLLAGEWKEMTF